MFKIKAYFQLHKKVCPSICLAVITLIGLSPIVQDVAGQVRRPAPAKPARRREVNDLSIRMDHLKDEAEQPFKRDKELEKRQQTAALAQIRDDYLGIQKLNKEMIHLVASNQDFTSKNISDSLTEIEKRASRLKLYLALPKVDDTSQPAKEEPKPGKRMIKLSFFTLDQKISSFINNSFFKNPGINDPDEMKKASEDLAAIINLSHQIKKNLRNE